MPSVIVTPPIPDQTPTATDELATTPSLTNTSTPNPINPSESAAPTTVPLFKTAPTADPTDAIPLVTERHIHTHTHTYTMGHKTRKGILYTTAFFVPPLAVYFRRGTDKDFALNVVLTILGWYVSPPFPFTPLSMIRPSAWRREKMTSIYPPISTSLTEETNREKD